MIIIERNNDVINRCTMCGKDSQIMLSDDEIDAFYEYLRGDTPIQECLPGLNRCEREFLKSGYCPGCQELLFGNGETERIF